MMKYLRRLSALAAAFGVALAMIGTSYADDAPAADEIEHLTRAFFRAKEADFTDGRAADYSAFYAAGADTAAIDKLFAFEKEARRGVADQLESEAFDVTLRSVSIDGASAAVQAYETYEYKLKTLDEISSRGVLYQIGFVLQDNAWKIQSIAADNELTALADAPNTEPQGNPAPDVWDEDTEVPDPPAETPQTAAPGAVPGGEYFAPFDFGGEAENQWQAIPGARYRGIAGTTLDVTGTWVSTSTLLAVTLHHEGSPLTCWVGLLRSGETKPVTLPLDGVYSIHVKPSAAYTAGNLILAG